MKKLLILTVILFISSLLFAASFKITGYLPSYRLESSEKAVGHQVLDVSAYTPTYESVRKGSGSTLPGLYEYHSVESWYGSNVSDIIYFSIKPSLDGSLNLSDIKERDIARLNNIKYLFGTNLVIAVSGSSDAFAPLSASEDLRRIFVNNLLDFCRENGFSGVDYDWEFPKSDIEIDNFSLLVEETAKLFSAENKTVSAAVSRFRPLKQEVYDNLNIINLMAYDFYGRHSTYESAIEAVEFLRVKYNIPPEKINLGIPFYGRIYSGLDPQYWTKSMIYGKIRNTYEIKTGQNEAGGYYYNGIDMVKKKTDYAISNNLAGIMIWELGQDSFDEFSLLRAIGEEIK